MTYYERVELVEVEEHDHGEQYFNWSVVEYVERSSSDTQEVVIASGSADSLEDALSNIADTRDEPRRLI